MAEIKQVEHDLGFVREIVQSSEIAGAPATIYLVWAAIVLVGFPLPDYAPRHVGIFWMIAGPVGWLLSAVLARRHARRRGQYDARVSLGHALHWGVMLVAIALCALLPTTGALTWEGLGPMVLLIVALAYILASIHLDRLLLWPGLMMAAGYAVLLFQQTYTWTIVGILVAAGLVVSAFAGGRRRAAAQD